MFQEVLEEERRRQEMSGKQKSELNEKIKLSNLKEIIQKSKDEIVHLMNSIQRKDVVIKKISKENQVLRRENKGLYGKLKILEGEVEGNVFVQGLKTKLERIEIENSQLHQTISMQRIFPTLNDVFKFLLNYISSNKNNSIVINFLYYIMKDDEFSFTENEEQLTSVFPFLEKNLLYLFLLAKEHQCSLYEKSEWVKIRIGNEKVYVKNTKFTENFRNVLKCLREIIKYYEENPLVNTPNKEEEEEDEMKQERKKPSSFQIESPEHAKRRGVRAAKDIKTPGSNILLSRVKNSQKRVTRTRSLHSIESPAKKVVVLNLGGETTPEEEKSNKGKGGGGRRRLTKILFQEEGSTYLDTPKTSSRRMILIMIRFQEVMQGFLDACVVKFRKKGEKLREVAGDVILTRDLLHEILHFLIERLGICKEMQGMIREGTEKFQKEKKFLHGVIQGISDLKVLKRGALNTNIPNLVTNEEELERAKFHFLDVLHNSQKEEEVSGGPGGGNNSNRMSNGESGGEGGGKKMKISGKNFTVHLTSFKSMEKNRFEKHSLYEELEMLRKQYRDEVSTLKNQVKVVDERAVFYRILWQKAVKELEEKFGMQIQNAAEIKKLKRRVAVLLEENESITSNFQSQLQMLSNRLLEKDDGQKKKDRKFQFFK